MLYFSTMRAVILAAGRSVRMGEQKLLMTFKGTPIIEHVMKTVLSCGFEGVFVVVSQETLSRLSGVDGVDYIVNPDPDRGQDSSFFCALEKLSSTESFAVFLGDKPMVTALQIIELRRCFELLAHSGKNALVPFKDGAPGHPAFYSSIWRGRFLHSDENARATLFRHKNEVEWTEACEGCFFDVDTPEDYKRLNEA